MNITADIPDDNPDYDLAAIERYLALNARSVSTQSSAAKNDNASTIGCTRRVRRLADQVAEAQQLASLGDATDLIAEHSPRVLRTVQRGAEAVKLARLRQNPAFGALAAIRARRLVTGAGLTALVIALGWSTAGVQAFAANDAPRFSASWWFAWAVEPFVSLALLTTVTARAYLASRAKPLTSPTVRRIEWLFLSITLLMNTWLHLPGVAHPFQFGQLTIHALGPIVAVCVVTVLPPLWAAIDQTAIHKSGTVQDLSTHETTNAIVPSVELRAQERLASALARTERLVRDGKLPRRPSANQIHKELGGAMDTARAVRDALRNARDPLARNS